MATSTATKSTLAVLAVTVCALSSFAAYKLYKKEPLPTVVRVRGAHGAWNWGPPARCPGSSTCCGRRRPAMQGAPACLARPPLGRCLPPPTPRLEPLLTLYLVPKTCPQNLKLPSFETLKSKLPSIGKKASA